MEGKIKSEIILKIIQERFRYKSDVIANNLIIEKQRENGPFAVTPIYHWLPIK